MHRDNEPVSTGPLSRRWGGSGRPRKSGRHTIAVLGDHMELFGGGFETELRDTINRTCQELDLDLLMVYGRALGHPDPTHAAHNMIYELMHREHVDGLITLSGALTAFAGVEGLERLLERCRPGAFCSIGLVVPGMPSIVVDNQTGMEAVVQHLVHDHGCCRVAYLGGPPDNPDAKIRLAAYRSVLERHGLPFDPELVTAGDFVRRSGQQAMEEMIGNGVRFDAVVAANDGIALGALAALRKHGVRVPQDVSVTGFDDLMMARLGDPPLSTVAQPIRSMAELAVRLVVKQLAGTQVDHVVRLPAQVSLRESCGCGTASPMSRLCSSPQGSKEPHEFIRQSFERIVRNVTGARQARQSQVAADAQRLLSGILRELESGPGELLGAVREILAEVDNDHERYQDLQTTITRLRDELRSVTTQQIEDLWHEARSHVALTSNRVQVQQRLEIDDAYARLIEQGEAFSTALDRSSFKRGLEKALPAVGIQTAFISVFPGVGSAELEPLVCLLNGTTIETPSSPFVPNRLVPTGILSADERRTLVVFPLVFKTRRLGVAAFEYHPGKNGFVVLRDQISSAFQSMGLYQEIVETTRLHERRIQEQERIATEKRVQSLNVLAGGVAHDLNNVLGPLVGLPDLILAEVSGLEQDRGLSLPTLRADVESIRSAAQRAAQTIKDLLTLSRQGRVSKEIVDLNRLVQNYAQDNPLHFAKGMADMLVEVELSPEPLFALASEAHVARAIENLVRNAVEAMDGQGTVSIKVSSATLREEAAAQERVQPGDYIVVSVGDTGKGIPAGDVSRVFEPFFSSKRMNENSGSGLGLAIVHGVVKEHNGFVNLQSSIGRGTTFTLYFPREKVAALPRKRISVIPRGRAKILVVDDEPIQLRTASRLLNHLGYEVETLSSGSRAYERFLEAERGVVGRIDITKSPYDLVILDMLLREELDGLQVFQQIQSLFPRQKAIIASGHAPPERAALAIEKGLRWLTKPYTTSALAHAVQEALTLDGGEREYSATAT
jgi:phosphoserine phosphatase RsbU/P